MGLDMYAYRTPVQLSKSVDFEDEVSEDYTRIATWRKHPNLHGWMKKLYELKGGVSTEFNCVPVELTRGDLETLRFAVQQNLLPDTSGFFFGNSNHVGSADLGFIEIALQALDEGDRVFYDSWW